MRGKRWENLCRLTNTEKRLAADFRKSKSWISNSPQPANISPQSTLGSSLWTDAPNMHYHKTFSSQFVCSLMGEVSLPVWWRQLVQSFRGKFQKKKKRCKGMRGGMAICLAAPPGNDRIPPPLQYTRLLAHTSYN